jgi:GNAT superfamily N-acetyltransferase
MASGVTCRLAKASDLDFLVRATMGNAWETEQLRLEDAVVRRAVKKLLADPVKGRAFVAEAGGKVVASLYVTYEWSDWHDAWYWWIQSLFVVPENRGQGVYTRLYRFVQDSARKVGGVRSIRLYVEKANENGLRAYRGHGMKEAPYLVFEQML